MSRNDVIDYNKLDDRSNKELLKDSIRMLSDMEQLGNETLIELGKQGEQIDKNNHQMDNINEKLNDSNKVLNKMSSFFGFMKKNKIKIEDTDTYKDEEKHTKLNFEQKQETYQTFEKDSKMDDDLDILQNSISNIKNISLEMNKELDSQNKKLDQLSEKTEKQSSNINGLITKIKKML